VEHTKRCCTIHPRLVKGYTIHNWLIKACKNTKRCGTIHPRLVKGYHSSLTYKRWKHTKRCGTIHPRLVKGYHSSLTYKRWKHTKRCGTIHPRLIIFVCWLNVDAAPTSHLIMDHLDCLFPEREPNDWNNSPRLVNMHYGRNFILFFYGKVNKFCFVVGFFLVK